jgi:hypothetical protein
MRDMEKEADRDDAAVDAFAVAMKAKMAVSREKGRSGWQECTQDQLWVMLAAQYCKVDSVDVGNFAMMIWNVYRSERS